MNFVPSNSFGTMNRGYKVLPLGAAVQVIGIHNDQLLQVRKMSHYGKHEEGWETWNGGLPPVYIVDKQYVTLSA